MRIVAVVMFAVGFGAMANGQTAFMGTVTDATGLTGRYDYTLFWSTAAMEDALTANAAPEPDGPSLFDAIEEQLGLKLDKKKGMVKMLVVPLPSERWATAIAVSGRDEPGLSFLIAGSLQVLISPR